MSDHVCMCVCTFVWGGGGKKVIDCACVRERVWACVCVEGGGAERESRTCVSCASDSSLLST